MATNMYHEKQALQVSNRSEDRLLSLVRILLLVGGVEPNPGPVEAGQLEIAALGRPFNLGMLYDARSEKTIPGVTLWDNETLKANVEKKEHKKVKVEIFENDTISGKTTALNLQANLKLSFLSGLVDIGGSGEYLKDYCDTTTTERITLQYNSTSHWESLGMDHLSTDKLQHLGVLEHKSATHIVTAIEYGADAFFLFDRKMSNKTDGTKFEGSLKSEIKGLKVMLGGSAAGKSKEKITDKSESIHCKYYGDFSLSNYPTNIKEARAAIQEIHKHLQSESVPKKVYLYPLSLLTDKAMKLVAQISASLLQRTEKQLQSLIDTRLIVSGILKVPELQHFGALKKEFMDYRAQVETSELLFQEKLRAILPNIRGGSMQESELTKVLETWSASMFRSDKMEEAVHGFKNELNYLAKKLHRIWQKVDEEVGEELKIEFSKPDEIDDNTVPILALEFNIADFRGSLIKECEESLIFLKSLNDPPEKREIKQVHSWYNDSEQKILAMQNMDIFLSFVASARKGQSIATKEGLQPARFVCVPDKSKGERGKAKSPISIVEYNRRNGTEINLPSYLSPPTVTNLTSNSAELEVELPSEGLEHILSVLILAKVNEHEYEIIKAQEHDNRNETKMVVKLDGLTSSTSYYFKLQPLTPWGLGPASQPSRCAKTESNNNQQQQLQSLIDTKIVVSGMLRLTALTLDFTASIDFSKLPALTILEFTKCTFEVNSQVSFSYCPSLKYLKFDECEIKSVANIDFSKLPALDTLEFRRCTFDKDSQISFTNCLSLKNMEFKLCAIKSSACIDISNLPALNDLIFIGCTIDLHAWQSITDKITSSSVKQLKLDSDFFWREENSELNVHLHKCEAIENIQIFISPLMSNEEQLTTNVSNLAREMKGLKSITFHGRMKESNMKIIKTAGRKRDRHFQTR